MSNDEIVWLVVLADYIVGAVFVFGALLMAKIQSHKKGVAR